MINSKKNSFSNYSHINQVTHKNTHLTLTFEDKKAPGVQSGILILKKVPSGKNTHNPYGAESTLSEAVEQPNFGNIVSKLISAASSSNPDSPVPFTDYKQTHPQPDDYVSDGPGPSDDSDHHDQGNFDNDFQLEPAFDSPEVNKVIEPNSSGGIGHDYKTPDNIHGDVPQHPDPPTIQQNPPKFSTTNFQGVPQGSDFGSLINVAQDFEQLNPPAKDHKPNPFSTSNDHEINLAEIQKYLDNLQNHASNSAPNINPNGGHFAEPPSNFVNGALSVPANFNSYQNFAQESTKTYSPNIFDHNFAEPPNNLLQYNLESSQGVHHDGSSANYGLDEQRPPRLDKNDFTSNTQFLGPYNPEYLNKMSQKGRRPPTPKKNYDKYRGQINTAPKINQNLVDPSSNLDLPRFPPNHHKSPIQNGHQSNFPPFPRKPFESPNRPPFSQTTHLQNRKKPASQQFFNPPQFSRSKNQPRPPIFDIVQSVTYQLGPNGPTKL